MADAAPPTVLIADDSIFWPGQDPVGRRMRLSEGLPRMTVVGVVADVKDGTLQDSPMPHSYSPYMQEADDSYTDPAVAQFRGLRFAIAAERDPPSMTNEIRQVIGGLDSLSPLAARASSERTQPHPPRCRRQRCRARCQRCRCAPPAAATTG